jgi:hypothetical protein
MNPFTSGSPSSFSAQLLSSDLSLISFWFRGNRNEFVPFVSVQQVSPYWFGSLDIRWNGFWGFGQEQQTIFHTSKSYRGEFCIFIFIHLLYLFSFCYGHRSILGWLFCSPSPPKHLHLHIQWLWPVTFRSKKKLLAVLLSNQIKSI